MCMFCQPWPGSNSQSWHKPLNLIAPFPYLVLDHHMPFLDHSVMLHFQNQDHKETFQEYTNFFYHPCGQEPSQEVLLNFFHRWDQVSKLEMIWRWEITLWLWRLKDYLDESQYALKSMMSWIGWNLTSKKSSTETKYGVWKLLSCVSPTSLKIFVS